jgi:hypothetical protein
MTDGYPIPGSENIPADERLVVLFEGYCSNCASIVRWCGNEKIDQCPKCGVKVREDGE